MTGCQKTYVMLFTEAEGIAHLHVHVVPRMPDQPEDRRGPDVLATWRTPTHSRRCAETRLPKPCSRRGQAERLELLDHVEHALVNGS